MSESDKPYRKNSGAIVFNSSGQVLSGNRIQYPDTFQLPQGGIDEGEDPLVAARRELGEETGLWLDADTPLLSEYPDWLRYDFPADIPDHLRCFRGQMQKWFLFYWDGDLETLSVKNDDGHSQEFLSLRWYDFDRLVEEMVPFKQPVYRALYNWAAAPIDAYCKALAPKRL